MVDAGAFDGLFNLGQLPPESLAGDLVSVRAHLAADVLLGQDHFAIK